MYYNTKQIKVKLKLSPAQYRTQLCLLYSCSSV
ncbi:hypothetical protein J2D69_02820 [Lysinibacillus sphaericus]|nr:hypothetical protein [Bacillus thuringiensis]QPA50524.1 hypothetical protein INQ54_02840 [Lysinibacillus sphaericus]QPA54994.1 hypothetical protein INQ53_02830 [Lysinibacillus sphaericus]QTB18638.1 hypothetical protein J2D69_02820 [Lysinibacillus sphaericus]QTB27618.1 hypothetical protein J2D51_02870 [Lysinibacillus sphaericus]